MTAAGMKWSLKIVYVGILPETQKNPEATWQNQLIVSLQKPSQWNLPLRSSSPSILLIRVVSWVPNPDSTLLTIASGGNVRPKL